METKVQVHYDDLFDTCHNLVKLEEAAREVLHEWNDWYDGPGYFPSSFVAAIIRLRRVLESK